MCICMYAYMRAYMNWSDVMFESAYGVKVFDIYMGKTLWII